jgi:hypothetical protein
MGHRPKRFGFDGMQGRRGTGCYMVTRGDWPWCDRPWEDWGRVARLRATSPTDGPATWAIVNG